jgi:hypothetical protein
MGIMECLVISMAVIPIPAPAKMYAQASVGRAVASLVEVDELAVAVLQLHLDVARDGGRGVTDVGYVEFDAIGTPDLHPMRGTIEGIPEGLAFGLQIPRDKDTSRSLILVHFELDGQAQIFENRVRHGVEYPPVIGSFLGLFGPGHSKTRATVTPVKSTSPK